MQDNDSRFNSRQSHHHKSVKKAEPEIIDLTGDDEDEETATPPENPPPHITNNKKRKRASSISSSIQDDEFAAVPQRILTSNLLFFPRPASDGVPTATGLAHNIELAAGRNDTMRKEDFYRHPDEASFKEELEMYLEESLKRTTFHGQRIQSPEDKWELNLMSMSKYESFGLSFQLAHRAIEKKWLRKWGFAGGQAFDHGCRFLEQYLTWRQVRTKWANQEADIPEDDSYY